MLSSEGAFSGISVNDIDEAKEFYGEKLGLAVEADGPFLMVPIQKGAKVFMYSNPDHVPAEYTVLNFPVDDIEAAVDALVARGVVFERYEGEHYNFDERNIARNEGPFIAWFKDPSGNVLSVLQEK